jgi:hypothetical protein
MCLALSGVGPGVASARHKRPLCVVYRCTTLAATAQIRVYKARNRHPAVEVPFLRSFARWLPTGRITPIGDNTETTRIVRLRLLALAGRFLADALEECSKNSEACGWSIGRLNAQSGRDETASVSFVPSELGNPNHWCSGTPPPRALGVTDIVVSRAGTVAWIMGGSVDFPTNFGNLSRRTVCELKPGSKTPIVVASSPTIEPKSLAAIPGHLYWTEAGTPRMESIP